MVFRPLCVQSSKQIVYFVIDYEKIDYKIETTYQKNICFYSD